MIDKICTLTFILANVCWAFLAADRPRVLGGIEASLHQFPYMTNIFYVDLIFMCEGSILNERTILTVAHCTTFSKAENFYVRAGSLQIGQGITQQVTQKIEHKDYDPKNVTNDIALLILNTSYIFSAAIQAIDYDPSYIGGYRQAIAASWTYPEEGSKVLLYMNVVTVEQEKCKRLVSPWAVQHDHMCAISGYEVRRLCRGYGGPLTINGKLVGIASWSGGFCTKGYPIGYTRVSQFTKWFREVLLDSNKL